MNLGIDAISTNSGGAIEHLKNLLQNFDKQKKFVKCFVFTQKKTLRFLPKKKNIIYITSALAINLFTRVFWQTFVLNSQLKFYNIDILFVTGGSFITNFKPIVSISQNLLPFDNKQTDKYKYSLFFFKLKILKKVLINSFNNANGVIFLTNFSKNKIIPKLYFFTKKKIAIIPHSVIQKKKYIVKNYKKFEFFYVSNIDSYKNQDFLIKAFDNFFKKHTDYQNKIKVSFYGSSYKPALDKFNKLLKKSKFSKSYNYHGLITKKKIYRSSKNYERIFLFSSSCENFSVSLLEGMAHGFPILCCNLNPMKDVLGKSALFYKNNSIEDFEKKLLIIIKNFDLRKKISKYSFKLSKKYGTNKIAKQTYKFIYEVYLKNKNEK